MYSTPNIPGPLKRLMDIAEMQRLLANGWQHIGGDLWNPPGDDEIFMRAGALEQLRIDRATE